MKFIQILFFGLLFSTLGFAQTSNSYFDLYDISNGLSNNQITVVKQTTDGMLWVGTRDGLNTFDGYEFTKYKSSSNNFSIKDNEIRVLFEDSKKRLWIGTYLGGLSLFVKEKNHFLSYFPKNENDKSTLIGKTVHSILEDSFGRIWVGTENGISIFDVEKNTFTHLTKELGTEKLNHSNNLVLSKGQNGYIWACVENKILRINEKNLAVSKDCFELETDTQKFNDIFLASLITDAQGLMFLATHNGIMVWQEKNGKLKFITLLDEQSTDFQLIDKQIGYLNFLEKNTLVLAQTNLKGCQILRYSFENDKFTLLASNPVKTNKKNPNGLIHDRVRAVTKSQDHTIWFATEAGLNKYSATKNKFKHVFNYRSLDPSGLPSNEIRDIDETSDGKLWVGMYGNGIVRYDLKTGQVEVPDIDFTDSKMARTRQMLLFEDINLLLVTTSGGGVYGVDTKTLKLKFSLKHDKEKPNSLLDNTIATFLLDKEGYIWFGGKLGVSRTLFTEIEKGKFEHFKVQAEEVAAIQEDKNGNLWLGTDDEGVIIFDKAQKMEMINVSGGKIKNLPNNQIKFIEQDENGNMWVGTGAGLAFYDFKTTNFEVFNEQIGLKNTTINGFIKDKEKIWLSTNDGLYNYDLSEKKLLHFTKEDGLQSNEFRKRCFHKGKSGYFYFGGLNGFNFFKQEEITANKIAPQVILTNLEIFNQIIAVNPESVLKSSLATLSNLTLSYQDYIFGFHFSALHFSNPSQNTYAYQLEGFDKDWVYTDANRRIANYSNISHGDYIFKIKAANADGIWGEETHLALHIRPAFWNTTWFRLLMLGAIIFLAVSFYLLRTKALKARNLHLEEMIMARTIEIEAQRSEIAESLDMQQKLSAAMYAQKEEILVQNEELHQTHEELMAQREFVEEQNQQLALAKQASDEAYAVANEQNQLIKDSIRYAKRIQNALLTNDKQFDTLFVHKFLILRPKDIISGDFYWASEVGNMRFAAVVDCTGHGVPGAFMSIIGNNFLNQIVNVERILSPKDILNALNEGIIKALKQKDSDNTDGMDVCLVRLEKHDENLINLCFAGARRPLYCQNENELLVLKGSKKDIGGRQNDETLFENHVVNLKANTMIYLTSDGIADQNNPQRNRFSSTKLIEILKGIMLLDMHEQKFILENELDKFKGDAPQRDDITLLGLRI